MNLDNILLKHKRLAIVGPVQSGKTTISKKILDRRVIHTDDYLEPSIKWEEQPLKIKKNCDDLGLFAVEGMIVPRTLRKGLVVDAIICLDRIRKPLNNHQAIFSEQCMKIFNAWVEQNQDIPVYYLG